MIARIHRGSAFHIGIALSMAVVTVAIADRPAAAASACAYDAQSRTVDLLFQAPPSGALEGFIVERGPNGSILFGAPGTPLSACEGATVTNTNLIRIVGSAGNEAVLISQIAGRFAPGATSESPFLSEIEFTVSLGDGIDFLQIKGSNLNDTMVFGAGPAGGPDTGAVAVNSDFDAEVTFDGVEHAGALGFGGRDDLLAQGTAGTGAPFPGDLLFQGGPGSDTLLGGTGDDDLFGGEGDVVDALEGAGGDDHLDGEFGADTLSGGPGNDDLFGEQGADRYFPGPGDDTIQGVPGDVDTVDFSRASGAITVNLQAGTASGEGNDTFSAVDNVVGTPFGDVLAGSATRNVITGGDGGDLLAGAEDRDALVPGLGRDDVRGGAAVDQVHYTDAPFGMVIDLAAGTAVPSTGAAEHTDTIAANVEDVFASEFDDVVHGSSGPNTIFGFGRDDDLFGREGNDTLDGGFGNDDFDGGPGTDTCSQRDGTGTLTLCENVGTFELKPPRAAVSAGKPLDYLLTWTHPHRWRRLDTVELRVRDGRRVLAWVRWNQESNTFHLFDPGDERFVSGPAGGPGTLRSPFAVLHLRGSDQVVFDSRTIGVLMRLSFRPAAEGGHIVEATAEDDRNNRMAWERAGTLKVR